MLEIAAHPTADPRPVREDGTVPVEHAIRGLQSVTLTEAGYGARVDIVCSPESPRGLVAAGAVHHITWRVADD